MCFYYIVIVGFGLLVFFVVVFLLKVVDMIEDFDMVVDMLEMLLIFWGLVCFGVVLDYFKIKLISK